MDLYFKLPVEIQQIVDTYILTKRTKKQKEEKKLSFCKEIISRIISIEDNNLFKNIDRHNMDYKCEYYDHGNNINYYFGKIIWDKNKKNELLEYFFHVSNTSYCDGCKNKLNYSHFKDIDDWKIKTNYRKEQYKKMKILINACQFHISAFIYLKSQFRTKLKNNEYKLDDFIFQFCTYNNKAYKTMNF